MNTWPVKVVADHTVRAVCEDCNNGWMKRWADGQAAGLPAVPANEQRDDEVPEAGAVNDAAVAAYRLSVQAGNPLSERRLAQMFGRTSRRWARASIDDARQTSSIQESPGAPAMA